MELIKGLQGIMSSFEWKKLPDFGMFSKLFLICLAALCAVLPAYAQTTYPNTTSGTVSSTASSCAAPLTRTFNVPTGGIVIDVDIGVFVNHPQRGDLRMFLISPSGTSVRIFNRTGAGADHINALFNDEGTLTIAAYTANDNLTPAPPPYQRNLIPDAALSAFDGQSTLGNWQLQICDNVAANDGTFIRADLTITAVSAADLSLAKSVNVAAPSNGSTIVYTLTLNNSAASNLTANGISIRDSLPLGVSYVSSTGTGSYSPGTGLWSVGSLAPNTTVQMAITAIVTATPGATIVNSAEVTASSAFDADSIPNNGSTTEDDDDSVSFTVAGARTAGSLPVLVCPLGSALFDWDANVLTAGDLNEDYTVPTVGLFNLGIATDFPFVAGAPVTNTQLTGGLIPAQNGLFLRMNNTTNAQQSTVTLTLPGALPGVQFRLFDVDFGAGLWSDKVTVTGTFNGNPVAVTLTNGTSNYVAGNVAIGDVGADDLTAAGTVGVTFSAPVDKIIITYGNHTTAPANPDNQWMTIHDITFCRPQVSVTATKLSSVITDYVNSSDFKMIPGALLRYCILFSNAGPSNATSVVATDALPANITYEPNTLATATSCSGASTTEDSDDTGTDESDPYGASVAGSTVTGRAVTVDDGSGFAVIFQARIN